MSCGGALCCEGLIKLFLGLAELFAGCSWIYLSFLACTCLLWISVCSQPQSPCIETPAEACPPQTSLNFGLISMHLFHCSHLLLSQVLQPIQGEELIDLGPDGGVMNQQLGAVEDFNFDSLSAL